MLLQPHHMVIKKSFTLLVASGTTPFFAFVSIISVKGCSFKMAVVREKRACIYEDEMLAENVLIYSVLHIKSERDIKSEMWYKMLGRRWLKLQISISSDIFQT